MYEADQPTSSSPFSVSMPASAVEGLDRMAAGRGFANRSQCLTALVRDHLVAYASELGDTVMMGVISLIYDHQKRNLQNTLTDIQHKYLREIVTIQLVHLEDNRVEVSEESRPAVLEVLCDECESALNFEEFEDTLRKEVLLTIGAR